ncbi:MAG: DUF433 domain-containing protein [Rhabdochlamydiaceae bacterium]
MNSNQQILLQRISLKPGLMGGIPTIRNMRFTVSDILEMLASGMTEAEILEQHSILEAEDIQAAKLFTSLNISFGKGGY